MEELQIQVRDLKILVAELVLLVEKLSAENAELKARLEKYEHPKNSGNSSTPPSRDPLSFNRNRSLREKTGKKPGGQKGHDGKTLEMHAVVDQIVEHIPQFCNCCGKGLTADKKQIGRRQVLDIPPIKVEVIEHQIFSVTCCCGHENKGIFPHAATNHISYGSNIKALIGYMSARQYVPHNRIKEYFAQVCGLNISEGTIFNQICDLAAKAKPYYDLIKMKVINALCIGSDETGCKINKVKHWIWTWQNDNLTYLKVSDNRGGKTISDEFSDKLKPILVHDCWPAQFNSAETHQICLAHLLRELNYFIEKKAEDWSGKLKKLFQKSISLKKKMDFSKDNSNEIAEIIKELEELLRLEIKNGCRKLKAFKNRMIKYKEWIFTFLKYKYVPADNNGSERAIRNVKVKQKISGQFKSLQGAEAFAILRSVLDTTQKNNGNVTDVFKLLANNPTIQPEIIWAE